jgi:hypothetical protein
VKKYLQFCSINNNKKIITMKFSTFIKKQIRGAGEGGSNNYQHTHDRVHFNNESRWLTLEEVCINEYGSCYGRNVGFGCTVPQDVKIPPCLLGKDFQWADFEYLPANYGYPKKVKTTENATVTQRKR